MGYDDYTYALELKKHTKASTLATPLDMYGILLEHGAVLTDQHFIYTTGRHGSGYINIDCLLPHVAILKQICRMLTEPFADIDCVAAAATGGIPIATLCAAVTPSSSIRAVWADKTSSGLVIERAGFKEAVAGKRVLVVEDSLNTGSSVTEVIREVRRLDGSVIGVSVICNRGSQSASSLDVPVLHELCIATFDTYTADVCPLCAANQPIVRDIGHGTSYEQAHPSYPGGFVSVVS